YNRMIDELDESAKKLARSERELAWREMARQIAHEIKNPLTPMKLNVQQLFKWWKDEVPDFKNRLETFTVNQIEYIDNLSSIATAFSNFARLPSADPVEMDLISQLKKTVELFSQTDGINIELRCGNLTRVMMMADKEHMNGIFSNLIKNAIQAIPVGRTGRIDITVSAVAGKALLVFKDNGQGIPEELKSKMFTPNFTTKSSGMGLGLSIVKRYVETAGGTVWYESKQGVGTSFFIELPVLFVVENH
ncbi:MAG TPA: ATP-binding protein, partial [Bacteroidales bacterium]|nr:ATP-binding protein [Bacteroidales bacterium]